jgi:hypothetical protein
MPATNKVRNKGRLAVDSAKPQSEAEFGRKVLRGSTTQTNEEARCRKTVVNNTERSCAGKVLTSYCGWEFYAQIPIEVGRDIREFRP